MAGKLNFNRLKENNTRERHWKKGGHLASGTHLTNQTDENLLTVTPEYIMFKLNIAVINTYNV